MASTDRRLREREELQTRILDAARDLFVKEGYEAVSLRRIAEAIEYTAPAIYTHFKDKADLLRTLCRRDFGALSNHLVTLNQVDDPVRRIGLLGRAYIRFAVEHPHHYRFMFMTPLPSEVEPEPDDVAAMHDPDQDGYAALRLACRQALERGLFRKDAGDEETVSQVLWACVHGVASLQITHAHDPCVALRPVEEMSRSTIGVTLRGLVTARGVRSIEELESGEAS